MSANWKPRLVKMPVPMILAITMEHAVTKPIVRGGGRAFSERRSAIVVMDGSTIPKLSGRANSFGVAFECMISKFASRPYGRLRRQFVADLNGALGHILKF